MLISVKWNALFLWEIKIHFKIIKFAKTKAVNFKENIEIFINLNIFSFFFRLTKSHFDFFVLLSKQNKEAIQKITFLLDF